MGTNYLLLTISDGDGERCKEAECDLSEVTHPAANLVSTVCVTTERCALYCVTCHITGDIS